MSGSVSPRYGIVVLLFFTLLLILVAGYGIVVSKLILNDTHSVYLRIIFGAITPVLVTINLLLSKKLKDKAIIIISIVLIIIINVLYLVGVFDKHTFLGVFNGERSLTENSLIVLGATLISNLLIIGFAALLYWIIKKTKL